MEGRTAPPSDPTLHYTPDSETLLERFHQLYPYNTQCTNAHHATNAIQSHRHRDQVETSTHLRPRKRTSLSTKIALQSPIQGILFSKGHWFSSYMHTNEFIIESRRLPQAFVISSTVPTLADMHYKYEWCKAEKEIPTCNSSLYHTVFAKGAKATPHILRSILSSNMIGSTSFGCINVSSRHGKDLLYMDGAHNGQENAHDQNTLSHPVARRKALIMMMMR